MIGFDGNDLRSIQPIWCAGCKRSLSPDEPHDEGCFVDIQHAASQQRGSLSENTPGGQKVFYLVYALFVVFGLAGYIYWTKFL